MSPITLRMWVSEVVSLSKKVSGSKGDIMPDDQNRLRAIISRWSGGLQAQLLELDIAVQGANEKQLLAEFAHAITVSFEIAKAHGEAPFASVGEPPKSVRDQWRSGTIKTPGWIELKKEVALALATALRWRNPVGSVVLEDAIPA